MGWTERPRAQDLEVRFIMKAGEYRAQIFGLSGSWHYEVLRSSDRLAYGREEKLWKAKHEAKTILEKLAQSG